MDKFSGLYIKTNGEWQLHGKLTPSVESLKSQLREMTASGGKIGTGKGQKIAEEACIIHSTKGIIKSRKYKV